MTIPTQRERAWSRNVLMAEYAARPRFQAIVAQDLRPLWRSMEGAARTIMSLDDCANLERRGGDKGYLAKLRRFVARSLRLTHAGAPAHWACEYLHGCVRYGSGSVVYPDHYRPDEASIRLAITPSRAIVRLVREGEHYDDGGVIKRRETELARRTLYAETPLAFDDWRGLSEAAQELVEQWAGGVRAGWIGPGFEQRNAKTLDRHREDLRTLCHYLFADKRISYVAPRDRLRLRRAARRAGIDLPALAQ